MAMLTKEEESELQLLRLRHADNRQWLSMQEFYRIVELSEKALKEVGSPHYPPTHVSSSCSVDCFDLIKDLLVFESEDDFYFLQILQRKKENPELGSNSRVIKTYYIKSVQHLLDCFDEIKALCNLFNARASLWLNKRSFEKVGFKSLEIIANTMQNQQYRHLMNSYDRACGLLSNEKTKKWIVDVDKDEVMWLKEIINAIQWCKPLGNKILKHLPTKSGIHLITIPFNVMQFRENLKEELKAYRVDEINCDIHKDNPINLYIPI